MKKFPLLLLSGLMTLPNTFALAGNLECSDSAKRLRYTEWHSDGGANFSGITLILNSKNLYSQSNGDKLVDLARLKFLGPTKVLDHASTRKGNAVHNYSVFRRRAVVRSNANKTVLFDGPIECTSQGVMFTGPPYPP